MTRAVRAAAAAAGVGLGAALLYLERRRRRAREVAAVAAGATLGRVVYKRRRWWGSATRTVALRDARGAATLDVHGAELAAFAPLVGPAGASAAASASDAEACAAALFPAAERLLERATGCARAICFDHVVRRADGPENAPAGAGAAASGPINFVHNDYSVRSGKPRARALLAPFARSAAALDEVLAGRVSVVNVWCPLADVESDPLAFVDFRSLRPTDCRVRRVTYSERVGETTGVYDASHRHQWKWFSDMRRGECMLLKTWDTKGPRARSIYAAHASASLVGVDAARRPRESVEMRCFCLFEPAARDLLAKPFVAPHIARIRSGEAFYEKVEKIEYIDEPADAWCPPLAS